MSPLFYAYRMKLTANTYISNHGGKVSVGAALNTILPALQALTAVRAEGSIHQMGDSPGQEKREGSFVGSVRVFFLSKGTKRLRHISSNGTLVCKGESTWIFP